MGTLLMSLRLGHCHLETEPTFAARLMMSSLRDERALMT